jgi:DNA polymerase
LSYCDPKITPKETPWGETVAGLSYSGTNSYTRKWERIGTYGGKLTENIVQALCRDLMADAMVRANAEFPIVLTVHDEIVAEVPESRPADTLSKFEALMARPPAWADGFPIAAEGWRGKRYRK